MLLFYFLCFFSHIFLSNLMTFIGLAIFHLSQFTNSSHFKKNSKSSKKKKYFFFEYQYRNKLIQTIFSFITFKNQFLFPFILLDIVDGINLFAKSTEKKEQIVVFFISRISFNFYLSIFLCFSFLLAVCYYSGL